jgi:hypothetical protein
MANEDSIDTAAAAFLADMGGASSKTSGGKSGGASDGPRETMFAEQGMEGDDEDFEAGSEEDQGDEGDEELPADEGGDEGDPEGEDDQGDDEDGEDGDEDEGEGDEGDQQGSLNLEQVVRVNVDGEEQEVTLQEALSGYIRTETFMQRLNVLNEAKSEILREQGETAQARQKYIDSIQALQAQLEEITPREPTQAEWDALYAEDPVKARQQEIAWRNYREQKAALKSAADKAQAEQAEQHKKDVVNWVRGEQVKILRAVPQWNDAAVRTKELDSMKRTAKSVGYSDEEIATLYDSRAVLVLRKAAAYDRMMAKKPKPAKTTVRQPQASGTGRPSNGQTVRKDSGRAMDNLRKTGSIDAATSVFGNILKSESQSRRKR